MPPVSAAVTNFLKVQYPKPNVDPEWLQACYDWVISEKNLNPVTDMQQIIQEVENQLLESDLRDSMLHGTGIPHDIADSNTAHCKLTGPPILVQIEAITDVGVSAYSLNKTRLIREERKNAGEEQEGEADGEIEGEGPIPNYSRSMLRLDISDGATRLRAAEYRPIPELTLGGTPLGYKLQIQNADVRRGIVFLEPRSITLKGHMVSERNENQQAEFAHGLRQRLGLPEPDADPAIAQNPALAQNARDVRSPLREISPPPSPTLLGSTHPHFDDEDQPRRRRVPNDLVSVQSTSNFNNPSSFFNDDRNANQGTMASHEMLRDALRLSPVPRSTLFDSDDENKDVDQETRHRLIKPIPARVRNSFTSTTGNGKASQAAESDYDGDDMFEDLPSSFFDDMDQVLSQSMQSMSTSASGVPLAGRSSGSFPVGTQAIIIEDNEEDDKENVAVQTRHVRPRIAQLNPNDVIELSDSD